MKALLALLLTLASAALAQAGQVRVAVAANLAAPMQQIAAAFARDTGHEARLALGSTGRFYAQVRNGAPFEVLLSADHETPSRLVREGLASGESQFTYAEGRLVLWSAQPGLVDREAAVLRRPPAGARLALADPRFAPYGAATLQVLDKLGVHGQWQPRMVLGESIGQAWQHVASGNAALGFVAASQVLRDGRLHTGSGWLVPVQLHAPLRQDAVLLRAGAGQPAAQALLDYLRGAPARAILRSFGYATP